MGHVYIQVSDFGPVHCKLPQAKSQYYHQHSSQPIHYCSPWFLHLHGACAHLYSCNQMFLSDKPTPVNMPGFIGVYDVPSNILSDMALDSIPGWCPRMWNNTLYSEVWMALVTGLQIQQNSVKKCMSPLQNLVLCHPQNSLLQRPSIPTFIKLAAFMITQVEQVISSSCCLCQRESLYYYGDICTFIFLLALFTLTKQLKQPRDPATDEWVIKWSWKYTVSFYST